MRIYRGSASVCPYDPFSTAPRRGNTRVSNRKLHESPRYAKPWAKESSFLLRSFSVDNVQGNLIYGNLTYEIFHRVKLIVKAFYQKQIALVLQFYRVLYISLFCTFFYIFFFIPGLHAMAFKIKNWRIASTILMKDSKI